MKLFKGSYAYTMFDGEKHGEEYDRKVESEIIDYMQRNGYECKKIIEPTKSDPISLDSE